MAISDLQIWSSGFVFAVNLDSPKASHFGQLWQRHQPWQQTHAIGCAPLDPICCKFPPQFWCPLKKESAKSVHGSQGLDGVDKKTVTSLAFVIDSTPSHCVAGTVAASMETHLHLHCPIHNPTQLQRRQSPQSFATLKHIERSLPISEQQPKNEGAQPDKRIKMMLSRFL